MVAWAGGKGGPHFFIALADHPEWKHQHTVFGNVVLEDMPHVDALLQRPLRLTKPKQPPIVSNFVTPIPFTIQTMH
jgi:cyclophilin family peptidyl-prolyl cis-trans isomerase